MSKSVKPRRKKRLGSYPFVSVIFSISLTLFVIGLFGWLLIHTNKLTEYFKENIEVQVYLDKNITENQRIIINKGLSAKEYVLQTGQSPQISFISKEEAAKKLIGETGEDFLAILDDNPLRDAYVLKISPEFQGEDEMEIMKKDIEAIPGVFEVSYVKSLINSVNENVAKISLFLVIFAVLLLIISAILINNTIKLALFSQRFLIRSMQLVGAKSSFIRKPFLSRAILHGILSGIFASGLLFLFINYANNKVEALKILQIQDKIVILYAILILFGAVVGYFSTLMAINKYLKLSLDELY